MNHQPTQPTQEGVSKQRNSLSHEQFLITILVIILTSILTDILFLAILAEKAVLGPSFPVLVISSVIAGSAVSILINAQLSSWTSNYKLFLKWGQVPTRKLLVILGSASALIAACLTILIISNGLDLLRLAETSQIQHDKFHVVLHGEAFDQRRLRSTLGEFDEARTEMKKMFPESGKAAPISLHLYPDMESYHENTGLTLSQGSMQCLPEGASIYAPLERMPNLITGSDGSKTPMHEMVHAAVCQVLGPKFHQIPDWFHEGTAEFIRTEQEHKLTRILARMRVWLAGTRNAPSPDALCAGSPGETSDEQKKFYMTATEFVRFLESKHGSGSLNHVIQEIQDGKAFEETIWRKFDGTCNELYAKWLKTW